MMPLDKSYGPCYGPCMAKGEFRDRVRRYIHPENYAQDPPAVHALDEFRSTSGELAHWEAEWADGNPFGEYHHPDLGR